MDYGWTNRESISMKDRRDCKETLSLILDLAWGEPSHSFNDRLDVLNTVIGRAPDIEHQVTLLAGTPPADEYREMSWDVVVPGTNQVKKQGRPDARGQFRLKGLQEGNYKLRVKMRSGSRLMVPIIRGFVQYASAAKTGADLREQSGPSRKSADEIRFGTEDQTFIGRVKPFADRLVLTIEGDPDALVGRMIRFTVEQKGVFEAHGFIGLYAEEGGPNYRGEVALNSFLPELKHPPYPRFGISAEVFDPKNLTPKDQPTLWQSIEAAETEKSRWELEEVNAGLESRVGR